MWKTITTHPNYEVSHEGVVRRRDNHNVLTNRRGSVSLSKDGKTHKVSSNKLLATYYKFEWIKDLRDGEEAKEIPWKPGYYITTQARVFGLPCYKWMKVVPWNQHPIYQYCTVANSVRFLHQIVGRTFLTDYETGLHILHIDETRPRETANWLDNLKVGTHLDNMEDMKAKGRSPVQVSNEIKDYLYKFENKYFNLVSYARTHPDAPKTRLDRDARLREIYMDETDKLASEIGDWQHGFHSGCLATIRMMLTALYPTTGEDGEVYGGLEEAVDEFPFLDT